MLSIQLCHHRSRGWEAGSEGGQPHPEQTESDGHLLPLRWRQQLPREGWRPAPALADSTPPRPTTSSGRLSVQESRARALERRPHSHFVLLKITSTPQPPATPAISRGAHGQVQHSHGSVDLTLAVSLPPSALPFVSKTGSFRGSELSQVTI